MEEDLAYKCRPCPRKAIRNPLLNRLLEVMAMQDGGALVPFDWLWPYEWTWLARLKALRAELTLEEMKRRNAEQRS